MFETYCGKSCTECTQKEALNCPGCKAGPGRAYVGECELAQCCQKKGHENCDTCDIKANCSILRICDQQPDIRTERMQVQQRQRQEIAAKVPVLGKWLWVLFWLFIPATIANMMGQDSMLNVAPSIYMTGQILSAVCSLVYGVILFKLSSEEERYRTAGICAVVASMISILVLFISNTAETLILALFVTIIAAIIAVVGEYYEYNAHAAVLYGVDREQSEKWKTLWKWYMGCMAGLIGSILLILIIPLLGVFVLLAAAIGTLVVSVMKIVYLYRTAKVFREYRCA